MIRHLCTQLQRHLLSLYLCLWWMESLDVDWQSQVVLGYQCQVERRGYLLQLIIKIKKRSMSEAA